MATVVDIDGELYKQRSPAGAWLLTLVTLLVYWFVWYYKINDEARRYLRDQSVKPWVAVLAIFPGLLLLLVPLLISVYRTGQRIERMERQADITKRIRPVWGSMFSFAAILAPLFFGATVFYYQPHLNAIWKTATAAQAPASGPGPLHGAPATG